MKSNHIDWPKASKPLLKKYKGKKHPLNYQTAYQLLVAVVLSAQDSDRHINTLAPAFFKKYPTMKALSKATPGQLHKYIGSVRNFANKAKWLVEMAKTVRDDKKIPTTLEGLTALKGIGRKSANVIMKETGCVMEGVIVDLHVLRVAPRLGIAQGTQPEKIEKQLMEKIPQKYWGEIGMALSFLGREICRPTNPKCPECPLNAVCEYYQKML
jgi:endonuclease III